MNFLICLLLNGLAVFAVSSMMSSVQVDGYVTAIIVAVLLGIVNTIIKPILTILTLPITILTLGLFYLVLNGAMVLLVDALLGSFNVNGLLSAIGFSILLSILNFFLGSFTSSNKRVFA